MSQTSYLTRLVHWYMRACGHLHGVRPWAKGDDKLHVGDSIVAHDELSAQSSIMYVSSVRKVSTEQEEREMYAWAHMTQDVTSDAYALAVYRRDHPESTLPLLIVGLQEHQFWVNLRLLLAVYVPILCLLAWLLRGGDATVYILVFIFYAPLMWVWMVTCMLGASALARTIVPR